MSSSLELSIRPPEDGDVDALVALYRACDEVDTGAPDSDREDVLWRWRTPEFDRIGDAWVAEDEAGIAGYGWVFEGLADVRVHPRARGRGLGTRLLALTEGRAPAQENREGMLRQNVTSRNPGAARLLEVHGYERAHHYTRLELELDDRPLVPDPPPGVTIRAYETGSDDAAVHEAFNRAWAQYEGDRWAPEPLERWLEATEAETFDPSTWHLAVAGRAVLAFCLCDHYPDLGWIQYLGTVPEARGRGLGRLLLLHAFAVYFGRGICRVGLTASSGNVPEAHRLYASVGMSEVLRYDNYKKPLAAL